MNDSCDWCLKQRRLYSVTHIHSGYEYHWCTECVRQNVGRNPTAYSANYGSYRELREGIMESYLANSLNARRMAESMQAELYDQDAPTAQQIHDRAADGYELDAWYDMPSDAVLDKYIDANPDKFPYVASGDNTADGLAEWAYLRSTAVGG